MLLVGDVLFAEHQHAMPAPGRAQFVAGLRRQGFAEVDATDLSTETGVEFAKRQGDGAGLLLL